MGASTIEWTDLTWNPVTGCDRVSAGCDHCYALTMAKRLKAMEARRIELGLLDASQAKYRADGDPRTSGPGFGLAVHPDVLAEPLRWPGERKVFVNSMGDLFHDQVPDSFIAAVFAVMAMTPQHTYQILTKRHARMRSLLGNANFGHQVAEVGRAEFIRCQRDWLSVGAMLGGRPLANVWLGVSAEDQATANRRIPALLETPAAVRFVSAEPLLGPIDLSKWFATFDDRIGAAGGLGWVVAGGESGHGARPMHPAWARSLRDQCAAAGVPFLFKQKGSWTWEARYGNPDSTGRDPWIDAEPDAYVNEADGRTADEDTAMREGGSWHGVYRVGKTRAGRQLDGRTWDEFPAATCQQACDRLSAD